MTAGSTIRLVVLLSLLTPIAICGHAQIDPKSTAVEVWCGGDDGLTLKTCDATERAFKGRADFSLATKERPAKYKVVIPTNVGWNQIGGNTRIVYTVKVLRMDDQEIGAFEGSCWESKMKVCGSQILEGTRRLLPRPNQQN